MKNLISLIVIFLIYSSSSFSQSGFLFDFKQGLLLGKREIGIDSTKFKRGRTTLLGVGYHTEKNLYYGGSISTIDYPMRRSPSFTNAFLGYDLFFGKKRKFNIPFQVDFGISILPVGRKVRFNGMEGRTSIGFLYLIDKESKFVIGLNLEHYYSFRSSIHKTGLSVNIRYFAWTNKSSSGS